MLLIPLLVSISSISAYSRCDPNVHPYSQSLAKKQPVTAEIRSAKSFTSSLQVSGTIRVVDGCNFELVNFIFVPGANAYWFGGNGTDSNAYRLSKSIVVPSVANSPAQSFSFIQDAGSAVSYTDFTQFRLFDPATNDLLATADLAVDKANPGSGNGPNAPPSNKPKTSASESNQSLLYTRIFLALIAVLVVTL